MAKASKPCQSAKAEHGQHPAYYQLHSLLQTIRDLAAHEDHICSLLHELEHTGKLSAAVRRELRALLAELPLHSLQSEIGALRWALEQTA